MDSLIPDDVVEEIISAEVRSLGDSAHVKQRQKRRDHRRSGFRRRIANHWGTALDTLEELVATCCELGDLTVVNHEDSSSMFSAQVRLWSRGCQVAWEILLLLRSGYADGAMARWRTLHEIAVVSAFLEKHGERAATQYLDHVHVKNRKIAREYDACSTALGLPETTMEKLQELEDKRAQVLKQYGDHFKEEYGWAAEFCGVAKPDFARVREAAGYAHWKAYSGMANHPVHAGPHGILFRLGHTARSRANILIGPSLLGLTTPLHHSAISLMHSTFSFVHAVRKEGRESDHDAVGITARMQYVLDLSRRAGEQALKTSKALEEKYGHAGKQQTELA